MTRIRYQVCVFFFLVSSNGLLKEGEDGVLFAGRGGDTREVFGGEDKVVQRKETSPSRLQQDNTQVWGGMAEGRGLKERQHLLDECGRLESRDKGK